MNSKGHAGFEDRFEASSQPFWRFVADGVMGGRSQGTLSFEDQNGQWHARLSGRVTTENNGGFIQFRRQLPKALPRSVSKLLIRVRGNEEGYFVFLKTQDSTRPWHSYRAAFSATPAWSDVSLPLASFERSNQSLPDRLLPERITSIGIVAYGRDHAADISVSEIRFE